MLGRVAFDVTTPAGLSLVRSARHAADLLNDGHEERPWRRSQTGAMQCDGPAMIFKVNFGAILECVVDICARHGYWW